jgi:hypothetical protein
MTYFKEMKIQVSSPEESEAVQKKLFDMGYDWYSGYHEIKYTEESFLYTEPDGCGAILLYGTSLEEFLKDSSEEVTPQQLLQLGEAKEHQNTRQREAIYTIKIIYKSGAIHEFDCTEFERTETHINYKSYGSNFPLDIGIEDIAAIYQVGVREEYV